MNVSVVIWREWENHMELTILVIGTQGRVLNDSYTVKRLFEEVVGNSGHPEFHHIRLTALSAAPNPS